MPINNFCNKTNNEQFKIIKLFTLCIYISIIVISFTYLTKIAHYNLYIVPISLNVVETQVYNKKV